MYLVIEFTVLFVIALLFRKRVMNVVLLKKADVLPCFYQALLLQVFVIHLYAIQTYFDSFLLFDDSTPYVYSNGNKVLLLVISVVLYPVLEEIFFRQYLFEKLSVLNPFIRILLISIAFSALHLNPLVAFAISLVLAHVFHNTKRIELAILVHLFFNLISSFYEFLTDNKLVSDYQILVNSLLSILKVEVCFVIAILLGCLIIVVNYTRFSLLISSNLISENRFSLKENKLAVSSRFRK